MTTRVDKAGAKAPRNPAFEKLDQESAVQTVLGIQRRMADTYHRLYPNSGFEVSGFDKVKLDMSRYTPIDCDRLFIEYGLARLLSKCAVGADRKVCKNRALETSLAAEQQCHRTNVLFSHYLKGDFSFLPRIAWCLYDAKFELRRLFGSVNEDDVVRNAAFGPGVSLGHRGLQPTKVDKLASELVTGTPYALKLWASEFPYFSLLTQGLTRSISKSTDERKLSEGDAYPPEGQTLLTTVHDEWTNVPKDRHTDRGICVSPTANVRYQKGLGAAMRQQLRSWGLHLEKQAEINSELARKGSLGEGFDTIDLQSASDTVSSSVVRFLFEGTNILRMMEGLRTPYTVYPGAREGDTKTVFLNKFSAMGNGYTFELETAIFAAIVRSAARYFGLEDHASDHTWSVFGDDICLPSEITPLVLELLDVLGFIVNEDKSFTSGYFRESCGKDWFCGVNIRPYFFKAPYVNDVTLTRFANGFRRWCHRSMGDFGLLDGRFRHVWRYIVSRIKDPLSGYNLDDDSMLMVCESDHDVKRPTPRNIEARDYTVWRKCYGVKTKSLRSLYGDPTLYAFALHFGKSLDDGIESYLYQSLGEEASRYRRSPCKRETFCHRWVC